MTEYFAIQGMYCGGCAHSIERFLQKVPGINAVNVSFSGTGAVVEYNPDITNRNLIIESIEELGYTSELPAETEAQGEASSKRSFERALKIRLAVAVVFGMWAMAANAVLFLGGTGNASLDIKIGYSAMLLAIPVVLYSGGPFYVLAIRSLRSGVLGMEVLISLAVFAAVGVSGINLLQRNPTIYVDTAAVLIAFQLLSRLADFSIRRNAKMAAAELLASMPEMVVRVVGRELTKIAVDDVRCGDVVLCRPGDIVPVDGCVRQGDGYIDAQSTSGESHPLHVTTGVHVAAGTIVLDAPLQIEATSKGVNRSVDKLAEEVLRALTRKTDLSRLADRAASWMVPIVLIATSVAMAISFLRGLPLSEIITAGMAATVVTCPCVLSLAIPLGIARMLKASASLGILLRDPSILEDNRPIDIVFLDKTGTLTAHAPLVSVRSLSSEYDDEQVRSLMGIAAQFSNHPVARSLVENGVDSNCLVRCTGVIEHAGRGVSLRLEDGHELKFGSAAWLGATQAGDFQSVTSASESQAYLTVDDEVAGVVDVTLPLSDIAIDTVSNLRKHDWKPTILSGDRRAAVANAAATLGIEYFAESTAEAKISTIRAEQDSGKRAVFVGDGLNDGPVLAQADIGVAVANATPMACSAASAVLGKQGLGALPHFLELVYQGGQIVRQNLWIAGAYNLVMIPVAAMGMVRPEYALAAMIFSVAAVVANSLRFGATGPTKSSPAETDQHRRTDFSLLSARATRSHVD